MRASLLFGLTLTLAAQRMPGSQLDHLPANVEVLTYFGERADISPDNQRIAFMAKSFGDAMVIDLESRAIRCLTCNVPGAAFLRVMHLVTGDYILIGPDHFEDIRVSRTRDNELWFLSKERGSKPVKFKEKMSEGMAISKKSLKVAYSQVHAQVAEVPAGASRLIVADVNVSGDAPTGTSATCACTCEYATLKLFFEMAIPSLIFSLNLTGFDPRALLRNQSSLSRVRLMRMSSK